VGISAAIALYADAENIRQYGKNLPYFAVKACLFNLFNDDRIRLS